MSLKIVHLAFILCSLALSLFVGVWGVSSYRATGAILGLVLAMLFFLLGAGLAVYAPRYWAKMKDLEKRKRRGIHLVVLAAALIATWLLPDAAHACAVCYGDPDSSQVAGLNNAIWVLLTVVAGVQVGFVALFVGFSRRRRGLDDSDGVDYGADQERNHST